MEGRPKGLPFVFESLPGVAYKKGDFIGQKYEVYGVLGKGGFGVVYLVYDHATKEVLALKTFRDELLASKEDRDDFRREALKWVKLGLHPYVLHASWVFEHSGRLYVDTDFIAPDEQGRNSLAHHLERGPISLVQALKWAIQFCHGMEHAYKNGIRCHLDIKPSNVMVTSDGTVKIADFGLARSVAGASPALLGKGMAGGEGSLMPSGRKDGGCGTPEYMPPEQFESIADADVRNDIYSFGVVLYQMASGRLPFRASRPWDGTEKDMWRYLEEMFQLHLGQALQELDTPLWPVIERCMRKERDDRYGGFQEIREELEEMLWEKAREKVIVPEIGQMGCVEWNNRGGSLAALGRHKEAIECFDRALKIDPRDAAAWNNKGSSLHYLGRYGEAIECYDQALEIDSQYAMVWSNKGVSLHSLGRYGEAIECYERALEIDPRYAYARHNKGNSLAALDRHKEAIECYEHALKIDPRYAAAWNSKGNSLAVLGRHEEVIECLDRALKIDPRYAAAWYNKGNSLAALGRHEEAIKCFERALEIDPQDADAWFNKALSEDEIGSKKEAVTSYAKFLELAPPQYAQQIAHARQRIRELKDG